MLYGIAEDLQTALAATEHPLRIYVPVGPIIPGMAYLVRRLLENSANTSFLRRRKIVRRPNCWPHPYRRKTPSTKAHRQQTLSATNPYAASHSL